MLRVEGFGIKVQGLGSGVWAFVLSSAPIGLRLKGSGLRAEGSEYRGWGLGYMYRIQGSGSEFIIQGSGFKV